MTAFIVIAIAMFVIGFIVLLVGDGEGSFVFGIVTIFAGSILIWAIDLSYRRGQIDALNGVIKYENQVNEDGETVWVEKKSN